MFIEKGKKIITKFSNLFSCQFSFSLNRLLLFVAAWSYTIGCKITFFTSFFVILLMLKAVQNSDIKVNFNINLSNILIALSYCLPLLYIFWSDFNYSLSNDQLYHAQMATFRFAYLIKPILNIKKIANLNIAYKSIINIINFAILILIILCIILYKKFEKIIVKKHFILQFLILILCAVLLYQSYKDLHPRFRLFPMWISSIFFGINNFAFRFTGFMLLILSVKWLYGKVKENFGSINAYLLGCAVITIPILFWTSISLEPSINYFVFYTYFIYNILFTYDKIDFIKLSFLIVIFSLMRIPIFFTSVPILGVIFLLQEYKEKKAHFNLQKFIEKVFYNFYPLLFIIPWLMLVKIKGNPATSTFFTVKQFLINLSYLPQIINNNINRLYLIFLAFIIIPINRQEVKQKLIILSLFIINIVVFFNITPYIIGHPKYTIEYLMPFIVNGIVYFGYKLKVKSKFLTLVLLILISINRFDLKKVFLENTSNDSINYSIKTMNFTFHKVTYGTHYNYDNAVKILTKLNLIDSTYLMGITYGNFSFILNGISYTEYLKTLETNAQQYWLYYDFQEIHQNKKIKAVIITDIEDKQIMIEKFLSHNWILLKKVSDRYKNNLYIFIRFNKNFKY